ncbi:MAG: plasmid pRiA4b ORF-3 family protein [Burkholderiales bacterium]
MGGVDRIYQLKVTLPYITPAIWRRVEVPGTTTFGDLHAAIQIAMGWEDCHLWAFYVGKTEISPESEQFDMPGMPAARPADRTTLDEVLAGQRIKFRYVYDMGDDWLHEIKVEKIAASEPSVQYPRCTGGARACPPEDCGGFPGYQNVLEAMADPKHPEHEEMLEWIGGEWDPEAFDMDAVNARLQPRKRRAAPRSKK